MDNIYHSQRISDEKFLRLVILKFEGVILTWWNKIVRLWWKDRRPKIDTWQHMKLLLSTCCDPSSRVRQIYDEVLREDKEKEETKLRERKLREKRERKMREER